jgi:hypothetical protein
MTLAGFAGIVALALLQGALVAIPKANALAGLGRLRSPAWAAALPGSIVIGTFSVRALPAAALWLVILAGVATPVLSGVAALTVVRGPRRLMLAIVATCLIVAAAIGGGTGQVSASIVTALGCLTLGIALIRMIPTRFLLTGVLLMCLVDVVLLALGAGQPAAALMTRAETHLHRPLFDHATISNISIDYPDLVLAAVLGGAVAGRRAQCRIAVALAILAAIYGMLLAVVGTIPATVPAALVLGVLGRSARLRGKGGIPQKQEQTARLDSS